MNVYFLLKLAEFEFCKHLQNFANHHAIFANFVNRPNLKLVVPVAVDRAIREILSAVVDRSVTISCLTSKEMVTKDFANEVLPPFFLRCQNAFFFAKMLLR